jgi:hypothetical protein
MLTSFTVVDVNANAFAGSEPPTRPANADPARASARTVVTPTEVSRMTRRAAGWIPMEFI